MSFDSQDLHALADLVNDALIFRGTAALYE
jgi:hypothetical protein